MLPYQRTYSISAHPIVDLARMVAVRRSELTYVTTGRPITLICQRASKLGSNKVACSSRCVLYHDSRREFHIFARSVLVKLLLLRSHYTADVVAQTTSPFFLVRYANPSFGHERKHTKHLTICHSTTIRR